MLDSMRIAVILLALGLLAACGDEKSKDPDPGKGGQPAANGDSASVPSSASEPEPAKGPEETPEPAEPLENKPADDKEPEARKAVTPDCAEGNDLEVVFSAKEQHKIEGFEVTHRSAYYSGMYYNGKTLARLAYVVFANYEHEIGRWGLTPSKNEGEVAVVVSFKTPSIPSTLQEQKTRYASLALKAGEYAPGWMAAEEIFQVTYYPGGGKGGPAISSDGTGTATVTQVTDHHICGTIEFVSPNGTTLRGEFSVPIEADLWK